MEVDSASIAMIVTLLILVVMSAYFSATETAYTSLNRIRLKNRAEKDGDLDAGLVITDPIGEVLDQL